MGYGDEQIMNIDERTLKYIIKAERVFKELRISCCLAKIEKSSVANIIEEAKRYLEDAKYYFKKREYEVSLASVAYCEGLLDALRMLGLIEFEW